MFYFMLFCLVSLFQISLIMMYLLIKIGLNVSEKSMIQKNPELTYT